jgi:uncharacterized protein (DUF2336 family)
MNAPLAFIDEIESSIAQSSGPRRAEMARHLTDLFLVNAEQYSEAETALIDDVFVRLVAAIEESSRALLAIRLAPMSKAPPKTLRALACDDIIDVASPILIQSEQLDDAILIECAKTKSQEHMLAISRRKALAEVVTDVLVERGDQQIVLSTARNAGARFSSNGFAILINRSDGDDQLAECVGARPDLPPQLFERLLETASESVRSKLAAENPHAQAAVNQVVARVADRIRSKAKVQTPNYATAQAHVESLSMSGQLDTARLEIFARAGQFEETVVALALMSNLPTDLVERKVNDEHAEFLLVLAKAIGLSWAATKIILELRSGKVVRSANDIAQCLKAFQRLNPTTAQEIIAFHRKREQSATRRKMH